MSEQEMRSADQVVAHRVSGATYQAISMLYGITISKARYICRRAAMAGKVTPEQIGWKRKPKPLRIPPEKYTEHWVSRVKARCIIDEKGCWLWQGNQNLKGYGQTQWRGKTTMVHRRMYEIANGVKLQGGHVCHRCDVRHCCNPDHMWFGDAHENQMDSARKGRHRCVRATHCPKGHPYDEKNTYIKPGGGARGCKACARDRNRRKAA